MIDSHQLKLLALIEVGVITALLIILVANGPLTSGSGKAVDLDPRIDFSMTDREVRVIEKELFVRNISGSEVFMVDEGWSAIGIYVEAITASDVRWNITYPGFPEGAPTVNGTSFPVEEISMEHIESSNMRGATTAISDEPLGNWTLNYIVEGGLVKISIVKVRFIA